MATSKILIDGVGIDLTGDTVQASKLEQGYTAHNSNGEQITGTLVPGTQPNIQPNKTATPSASQQVIRPDSGYDALEQVTISAVPTGTAGTPTATKGAVSNHSVTVTPGVTNVTGHITGGTKTGTPVTVSASELVSGSETKTQNGTYDVTNLAQVIVNVAGSAAQTASGTITLSQSGTGQTNDATGIVNCGFKPDAVFFGPKSYYGNSFMGGCNVKDIMTMFYAQENFGAYTSGIYYCKVTEFNNTGFAYAVNAQRDNGSGTWISVNGNQVPWAAVKWA